jgi:flagellar biosynthesis/type III secretory pathway chaperone
MASTPHNLIGLLSKEYTLFGELLKCLESEKDHLINLDVDHLCSVMGEKQKILKALSETRDKREGLDFDIPTEDRRNLQELHKKINHLREEVRSRAKENMSFIKDSLEFFDEIISIFTAGNAQNPAYGPKARGPQDQPALIYRREV